MTLRVVQTSTSVTGINSSSIVFPNITTNLTSIHHQTPTSIWETPTSGNLLVAYIGPSSGTITTLSGWTKKIDEVLGGYRQYMFYKISDGTESTITFTGSASTVHRTWIMEIEGADTSGDPFDDIQSLSTFEASPVDLTDITTTTDESLLLINMLTHATTNVTDTETGMTSPTTPDGYTFPMPPHFSSMATAPSAERGAWLGYKVDTSGAGTKSATVTHTLGSTHGGYFMAIKGDSSATDLVATTGSVVTVVQNSQDGSGNVSGASFAINGSTTSNTSGCSDTWTTPTSGNVLICIIAAETATAGDISPPSGFTEIDEFLKFDSTNISYKISDGTESSITIPAITGGNNAAIMLEVSGLDTDDLIEGSDLSPEPTSATQVAAPAGSVSSTAAGTWALAYGTTIDGRSDKDVYIYYNGERLTGLPSQGCSGGTGASDPTLWINYKENQDNRTTHRAGIAVNCFSNRLGGGLQGGLVVFKTIATAAASGGGGGSDGGTNLTGGTNLSRGTGLALPTAGLAIQ